VTRSATALRSIPLPYAIYTRVNHYSISYVTLSNTIVYINICVLLNSRHDQQHEQQQQGRTSGRHRCLS
jgi:hypothetical protein